MRGAQVADGRAVLLLQLRGARNTDRARRNPILGPPSPARPETDLDTLCTEHLMQKIRAAAVSQGRPRQLWAKLLVEGLRRQSRRWSLARHNPILAPPPM